MRKRKKIILQKIMAVILTVVFLCQPVLIGAGVLAEGELTPTPTASEPTQAPQTTPEPTTEPQITPTEAQPTPTEEPVVLNTVTATPTPDTAISTDTQTTEVTNNNQAEVSNDVNTEANTGDNVVGNYEPTATPTVFQESFEESVTPTQEPQVSTSESPIGPLETPTPLPTCSEPSPTQVPKENSDEQTSGSSAEVETATPTPTVLPSVPPTPGPVAENSETPDNSSNTALCTSQEETIITNNNDAVVGNSLTDTASSGGNVAVGKTSEIETGDSIVQADLANVVNLNLIGQDFWTEVFNLLGVNNGDLDFSSLDMNDPAMQQRFNEAVTAVMARNFNTGNGSANFAAADLLSSLTVTNNNVAAVTNTLDLSAVSGQNTGVGGDGEISTGNSSIYANLFNLINTNLIGNNFWFGVFNIFGDQNGDLILPYELQFLQTEIETETENVVAVNQNTGKGSQNLAIASENDVTTVENNNEATVINKVDVLADSGTNVAGVGGSAEIKTGDASAKVDIRNFVNTNILGGKFVFLLINVFGKWQGMLLNWWGNTASDGKTVLAVGQLPPSPQPADSAGQVGALNQDTGGNSQNLADASSTTSSEITNNNQATLTNEIKGQAISGQNKVYGETGKVQTGNSSAVANIANFVNTNIIGNNFFFGIINIFGNFYGNIMFPRPDLEIGKSADKQFAAPGENISYTISYKNSGRVWAKDVVITDSLSNGLSFISASGGGVFENGKIIWKIPKINSGEAGSLSVIASVSSGLGDGTQLTNQVAIVTTTDEPNKNNNQSAAATTVKINGGVGGSSADSASPSAANSGSSDSPQAGSGKCIPPEAPKASVLLSVTQVSSTEVKLSWTPVDKASYYLIAYGLASNNYIYGSPNVGNTSSYIVGSLTPGKTYYFVVAAVTGSSDCPAAGPFSNELTSSGFGGVLGAKEVLAKGGEIDEGISTEVGEVAGAATPVCPWWLVFLAGEAMILAGFYAFLLKKVKLPRFWWLTAPVLAVLAFLGDKFAHHWLIPSHYCQYVPWGGLAIGGIETLAYNFFKQKNS